MPSLFAFFHAGVRKPGCSARVAAAAAGLTVMLCGTAQAEITLTPSTIDFGNVEVGQQSAPIRVTLANVVTGTNDSDPILVSMGPGVITGDATGSQQAVTPCVIGTNLMRGESCVFDYRITPNAEGVSTLEHVFGFVGWADMTLNIRVNGVPVGTGPQPPVGVPTLGTVGLCAMSLVLGAAAFVRRKRKGKA